jgi:hypothetical protein
MSMYRGEYYSVRIKAKNLSQIVDHIRDSWTKAFPGNPFDYFSWMIILTSNIPMNGNSGNCLPYLLCWG